MRLSRSESLEERVDTNMPGPVQIEASLNDVMSLLRQAGVSFRDAGDLSAGWRDRAPADLTRGLGVLQTELLSKRHDVVKALMVDWLENPTARPLDEWLLNQLEQHTLPPLTAGRAADTVSRFLVSSQTLTRLCALVRDRRQPHGVRSLLLVGLTKGTVARSPEVRDLVTEMLPDPQYVYQTLPAARRLGIPVSADVLAKYATHEDGEVRRRARALLQGKAAGNI